MHPVTAWLLGLLAITSAASARADLYREVAADGTITLSNIQREGRQPIHLRREPAAPQPPRRRPATPTASAAFAGLIARAAAEHDLPAALLHAVIQAESNYNPRALSPRGAAGLMQLMPATAQELGVEDVWDPAANVRGGARYLKRLLGMFDHDLSLALAAYNAGPGAVSSRGRVIPPFAETQRYVPKVLEYYRHFQEADQRSSR